MIVDFPAIILSHHQPYVPPYFDSAKDTIFCYFFSYFLIQSQITEIKCICSCYLTQNIAHTNIYVKFCMFFLCIHVASLLSCLFVFLPLCIKTKVPLVHFSFSLGRPAAFLYHHPQHWGQGGSSLHSEDPTSCFSGLSLNGGWEVFKSRHPTPQFQFVGQNQFHHVISTNLFNHWLFVLLHNNKSDFKQLLVRNSGVILRLRVVAF